MHHARYRFREVPYLHSIPRSKATQSTEMSTQIIGHFTSGALCDSYSPKPPSARSTRTEPQCASPRSPLLTVRPPKEPPEGGRRRAWDPRTTVYVTPTGSAPSYQLSACFVIFTIFTAKDLGFTTTQRIQLKNRKPVALI